MKKKILHLQVMSLLSGVQNVMMLILKNLPKDEYDIYVASDGKGALVDEVKKCGFTYISLKYIHRSLTPLDFPAFIELYLIMKKYNFDIVHTHTAKQGFLGRIAAKMAKVPKIIHTHHGLPFHDFMPKPIFRFYEFTEILASRLADYVVFINNDQFRYCINKKLVPRNKARLIYNGYKATEVKPQKPNKNFTIGIIARFSKQKNPLKNIDIAIEVCKKKSKIKFIFVGDGAYFKECKKKVVMVGLHNRIKLVGWQTNSDYWYSQFDAFMLFTLWEGMPLAILEAMNHSLPIVASNINGNKEMVEDGKSGYLVDLDKIDYLIELLSSLPDKADELKKFGKRSREILKEKFGIDKFVKSYLELYND